MEDGKVVRKILEAAQDGTTPLPVAVSSSSLPTDAASASNQTAEISKLDSIKTVVEGSLTAKIDQTIPGTTNRVVAGSQYVYDVVTFIGTGAYSAGDVLGTIAALVNFASSNGRGGIIRELGVRCNKKSMTFALRLHFFNASDPTVAADNAQWKELWADRAKWKGYVDLPALTTAADVAGSDCSRIVHDNQGQGLSKFIGCGSLSTSIWIVPEITTVGATAFDGAPGNTVEIRIGWERL